MSDLLEQNLRDIFSERATQIDPAASARLRGIDYRPRRRRRPALPALGALGVSATAAAVVAVATLASSAAPAFAGWSPTPTRPAAGQLAAAEQACSANRGTPVLTDTRGPYTASIYADATSSHLCLEGGSLSIASSNSGASQSDVPPGQIQLAGSGMKNSAGQALTLVDGRIGAGVTSVTIDRSDGSSIQATVSGGWYLAWWPGTAHATTADVTTTTGTATEHFPSAPQGPPPAGCPTGSHCSSGYSFGSARPGSTQNTMGSSRSQ
ncbi:MAG TPA: hypothetical protein VHW04_14355 [Solirubrobacteraceae bacterium]|nr:hypothetical protein [Solirubrobacteraceae bacterium]